jgi:hypothetical protein
MSNPWVNGWWPKTPEEAEEAVRHYADALWDAYMKFERAQMKALDNYARSRDKAIHYYRQYVMREYERGQYVMRGGLEHARQPVVSHEVFRQPQTVPTGKDVVVPIEGSVPMIIHPYPGEEVAAVTKFRVKQFEEEPDYITTVFYVIRKGDKIIDIGARHCFKDPSKDLTTFWLPHYRPPGDILRRIETETGFTFPPDIWSKQPRWVGYLGMLPQTEHARPAVIRIGEHPHKESELEYLADSPEFLAQTIEDIGYRDKLDRTFREAIARAKRLR